jgi:hypothetical protein
MMMLRTGEGIGALMLLIEEFTELLKMFIVYLKKMLKLRANCMVMAVGTLSPLLPDHMIREHEYVLSKIEEFLDNKKC